MGITVSPPAAASGSLASYHLESVKLFSSKEESRFLNPEKNVKDPLCGSSQPCYVKVLTGQNLGEFPGSKRTVVSLLSQAPGLSSLPAA